MYEVMFFDTWKYAYCEGVFITYTEIFIDWDNTNIFKKSPSDKINGTKNALFSFASSNLSQFYF